VVVRQAKTAASSGLDKLNFVTNDERHRCSFGYSRRWRGYASSGLDRFTGARLGILEDGGAKMAAPSRAAFISAVFMRQSAPWRVCQALTA
jgi:hypothetical protein